MLFFTVIFSYSINLLRASGWQCGILRASTRGGSFPITPTLLQSATGLQHRSGSPAHAAQGGSSPAASPVPPSRFPLLHPRIPLTSGSTSSFLQSPPPPFHPPMHWPAVLCREPRKHQSRAEVRCWLRDPESPTPTHLGTPGQLQVPITWRKQPVSSVCITCRRRKTTESAGGQKQQLGEEEFIKRKGKGSKACLCKGRASGKPSCDLQPQGVGAGATATLLPPHHPSPLLGLSW